MVEINVRGYVFNDDEPDGRGAHKLVYRGKDVAGKVYDDDPDMLVAIKIYNGEESEEKLRAVFQQDREAYNDLSKCDTHPNIEQFVASGKIPDGKHKDKPCIITEWIDGDPIIKKDDKGRKYFTRQYSFEETLNIMSGVADGLSHIHKHGKVIHDLALKNIIVSKDLKNIKICDLGSVKNPGDTEGDTTYSPMYQPPELRRGEPPTKESDVYSLGACMLYMLRGKVGGLEKITVLEGPIWETAFQSSEYEEALNNLIDPISSSFDMEESWKRRYATSMLWSALNYKEVVRPSSSDFKQALLEYKYAVSLHGNYVIFSKNKDDNLFYYGKAIIVNISEKRFPLRDGILDKTYIMIPVIAFRVGNPYYSYSAGNEFKISVKKIIKNNKDLPLARPYNNFLYLCNEDQPSDEGGSRSFEQDEIVEIEKYRFRDDTKIYVGSLKELEKKVEILYKKMEWMRPLTNKELAEASIKVEHLEDLEELITITDILESSKDQRRLALKSYLLAYDHENLRSINSLIRFEPEQEK